SDGVTLVCATNLLEALDPALTRPGRIDRIIHVPFPSKKERIEILKHYAKEMPLAADVDLEALAGLTSGMTGADLSNLLNFAAIRAATEGKEQVTRAEVDESFDRLMVGSRRTGVVMKEEERRLTAYHEVRFFLKKRDVFLCSLLSHPRNASEKHEIQTASKAPFYSLSRLSDLPVCRVPVACVEIDQIHINKEVIVHPHADVYSFQDV
ncbi:putative ATP-dependent metalloprotease, partial [Toxoplasma gondii FOU]